MRILLITDDYLPHQGGSRVYYHNILLLLREMDRIVLTRQRADAADFDRQQPYRILRCPLRPWPFLRPLRLQFLPIYMSLFLHSWRTIRRFRPDVLIAGELVPTGPVAAVLAGIFRTPLVVVTHAEGPSTLARTRWQWRLARWACSKACAVVANTDYCKDLLVSSPWNLPEEKITTIMPAVGEEHFDLAWTASPCAKASRRLLSVSRLVPRKGHLNVLRALPAVLKAIPQLEYIIAGSGPLEDELKRECARLGLEGHVRFLGKISNQQLLAEYAQSDCFVLPNIDIATTGDTEGFGIVFVEASAHGLPVVGGRTAGTEKAILHNRTGLRVESQNPDAVAAAIVQILSDPLLAQSFGRQGMEYARTHMRWQDRAEAFVRILNP